MTDQEVFEKMKPFAVTPIDENGHGTYEISPERWAEIFKDAGEGEMEAFFKRMASTDQPRSVEVIYDQRLLIDPIDPKGGEMTTEELVSQLSYNQKIYWSLLVSYPDGCTCREMFEYWKKKYEDVGAKDLAGLYNGIKSGWRNMKTKGDLEVVGKERFISKSRGGGFADVCKVSEDCWMELPIALLG